MYIKICTLSCVSLKWRIPYSSYGWVLWEKGKVIFLHAMHPTQDAEFFQNSFLYRPTFCHESPFSCISGASSKLSALLNIAFCSFNITEIVLYPLPFLGPYRLKIPILMWSKLPWIDSSKSYYSKTPIYRAPIYRKPRFTAPPNVPPICKNCSTTLVNEHVILC